MLRIVLPAALVLLILPLASATPFCPSEGSPALKRYGGNCFDGPFTPPLVYAAACSASLLLYANYLGSYALNAAGQAAGDAIHNVDHVVFGTPC